MKFHVPHLRWLICGLLFLATVINYVDRQAVSVLNAGILKTEIGWDDAGYGWIMFAFQLAYAIGFPIAGRLVDKYGVRAGMVVGVIVWSLAGMGHALARTPFGFAAARFALGLGESVNFPASVKAVAEWFPRQQRALATGFFNAGTNVGVMLAPLIVWMATTLGWRGAFIASGVAGFAWLALWLLLYRRPEQHPNLSPKELAFIQADDKTEPPAEKIPWSALLRYRQTWAFFLGKMLTDPVWWFYLYWLPGYLNKERGLTALDASVMLFWPYLAADFGSIFGGWFSGHLIKRGWSVGRARRFAMGLFAVFMPGAIFAVMTDSFAVALTLISLATGAHQAWSCNLFTIVSDLFPKRAVASIAGLGSLGGALGGMLMTLVAGGVLQWFGTFTPLFMFAGLMHVTAWFIIRILAGKAHAPAEVRADVLLQTNRTLITAGAVVGTVGAGLATIVLINWQTIATQAHSTGTAAAGLVATSGIALIGVFVANAGRKRAPAAA